jgi:thimet oligopeptidase
MKGLRAGVAALAVSLVVWASAPAVRSADPIDRPFATGLTTPDTLTKTLDAHLIAAQNMLDEFMAAKGPRTVENTLQRYDDIWLETSRALNPAMVLANMHPDPEMQKAADAILVRARALEATRKSSRAVYDALAAIDASHADAATRYYLRRELATFRQNGVDKDAATRARIDEVLAKLAVLGGDFRRNFRTSQRSITVASAADLDGLPADFIARHKPGPMGGITLKADDSDLGPVMTFAKSDDVRRRLYHEATNIAYPENNQVLLQIIAARWELARLVGFDSVVSYDAASRMVGTAKNAADFMEGTIREAKPEVAREYGDLLKEKRKDVPGADRINAWEYNYYRERVRKTSYDFDSQSVRPYLAYDRVRDGVLATATRMFGYTFRERTDIPVWHPSVQVYEMLDGSKLLGRIYLDMHPRPNKQTLGGLTFMGAVGVEGGDVPEAVIDVGVPGGQPGDPGLLTIETVRSPMFHEFAHAIQNILGNHQKYAGLGRVAEDDFIEAVPRLFEEWPSDPNVLATFARHYQTGAPMPADLIARMRRASQFGKGMTVTAELAFYHLAFLEHERDPKSLDLEALTRDVLSADAPWMYADGSHRESSFTQSASSNYGSAAYTYSWSQAIAKDMLTQFDPTNLLAPGPAHRLRDVVMKRGGSRPADDSVREFLGRPFNLRAWSVWINKEPS